MNGDGRRRTSIPEPKPRGRKAYGFDPVPGTHG